ncbi:hypothetical protein [Mycoplasmopsis adleri]|uniref:hypothetical protein n=1 Tax=Mycoplasmopsis adleri TaxID=51362 RepID=UPI003872D030
MMNYLRLAWIKENNIKVEYNQQYELFKKDLSQIIDTLKQNNLDLVYDQRINLILNGNHDYFWNNKFDLFIHKQGFESFRKVLLENFDIVELKPNSGYLASYIINIPYSANTFTINIKVLTSDNTINFEDTNFKLESYSDYFLNILKEYSLKTEIKNPNDQVDAIYDISLLNESAMSNKIDINVLNDFANKYCTNLEEIYFNLLKICNYILDLTNLRNIFKLRGQYDYQHSS